jgi:Kef-type K+ transport system membrane component KefB
MDAMVSMDKISARKMHTISEIVILLGLFFISYGVFFDINLISLGVISMMCGSCISIISMRSYQELVDDEVSDDV